MIKKKLACNRAHPKSKEFDGNFWKIYLFIHEHSFYKEHADINALFPMKEKKTLKSFPSL
jgi:hypothetical protein